ncbi:hypothetical protein B296_00054802 [Ensete ventricosum]|uniref:Uncharacterized protein n=1 Tax=Ensete ventricosum TaxID=4639 RepID=A0A426Y2B0_ENSVE|nr:hypothetical protein B296_00054802 [Ensete ventricosum]
MPVHGIHHVSRSRRRPFKSRGGISNDFIAPTNSQNAGRVAILVLLFVLFRVQHRILCGQCKGVRGSGERSARTRLSSCGDFDRMGRRRDEGRPSR